MSGRYRMLVPALLVAAVVIASIALAGGLDPRPRPGQSAGASAGPNGSGVAGPTPIPTPRPPLGGTELYGYLPYWQMTNAVAEHLRSTPVTTLALFSVRAKRDGTLSTGPLGYRRITGDIGRRVIREAHDRDARVELVFSSFGATRNGQLFGRLQPAGPTGAPPSAGTSAPAAPSRAPTPSPAAGPAPWERTLPELVALAKDLGVDGINVDIEQLDPLDRASYGAFLAALRAALRDELPRAQVSVATEAGDRGIQNAAVAAASGVDRLFLMGYDYHYPASPPGASAPIDRDDGIPTLRWSITRYVEEGVPRDRIVLGLPLYGMTWRTTGPDRHFPVIGDGAAWIPYQNLETLEEPAFAPTRDDLELADWFAAPDPDAAGQWLLTYFDSPATLRPKLALARDQGLAGGGFWALGYDRGLPGYARLMADFVDGDVGRDEAPPSR